ncbi:hypothetical protein DY000_02030785 [Brassica cretica]|uniref:Uncharacterized protein n=1 Tax=Brassica cretica TaxID=69181 RepID=A0ABQ7DIR2_BRACR|nr:hypothetical protein DY000_02030785 [Brassica cretica]
MRLEPSGLWMIVEGLVDPGCQGSLEPLDLAMIRPRNPWVLDPEGPHSAILGEATLGTCWGIAFYRLEASHYRVPVLHAAFCKKPLSGLEGAGVGENPSARLCCFPRLEKQDIIRDRGQDSFHAPALSVRDHCLLLMKVFSTSMKCVVTFIHWSDQDRRSPAPFAPDLPDVPSEEVSLEYTCPTCLSARPLADICEDQVLRADATSKGFGGDHAERSK